MRGCRKIVPSKNGLDEKKRYICISNRLLFPKFFVICSRFGEGTSKVPIWRDARVVEEARLESV